MTTVCIEPQTAERQEQAELLRPGTKAPDFTLHVTPDQCLSLSDLAGAPVVIAFYPADWSPVCGDQMTLYNEALPEFEKYGAEILHLGRRRLVSRRLRQAPAHPLSSALRFRAEGSGRQAVRRLPRGRGNLPTRALRHRP